MVIRSGKPPLSANLSIKTLGQRPSKVEISEDKIMIKENQFTGGFRTSFWYQSDYADAGPGGSEKKNTNEMNDYPQHMIESTPRSSQSL